MADERECWSFSFTVRVRGSHEQAIKCHNAMQQTIENGVFDGAVDSLPDTTRTISSRVLRGDLTVKALADALGDTDGGGMIWVVYKRNYDGSGAPVFLAAYDGQTAELSARALIELVERAGADGAIEAVAVPLWPLLTRNARHPSPDRTV